MFGFKRRRRERIRQRPFPPQWLTIIERNVPYYSRLPREAQAELRGHILVFLDEKRFEGCGGLELTDEIRLTIAAQACILLLNRETKYYPGLKSIYVYPHAYVAEAKVRLPDGTVIEGGQVRLGESWSRGSLVLAWDHARRGAADIRDGRNVVLHEFAHQLDTADGYADGAPTLPERSMYVAWARVLGEEYRQLIDDLENHRRTLISDYGATSPAEFFAVVTECFFERSVKLKRRHPELYEQMAAFYRQDPAALSG
ncbi:MAG: zinc-dependent peptidase [Phycisphaerales bacterium]|nr:MAG: zinc-dependent peptidase [Phycisphaerales bacterium]